MHDVNIRRAALGDLDAISSLAGELGYPATAEEMLPRLAALANMDGEVIFVAVLHDVVIGWTHAGVTHSLESGTFVQIRGLIVTESQRAHGVGALLVNAVEEWAKSRGIGRVRVWSNIIRERTHRFYERHGYTVRKTQKAFEKIVE